MFTIDKMSRTPIYEQLISQFEARILSGDIDPEGKLPSVRQLSQELGINPNTLQRAYLEIERRGLCVAVPGNGRFLSKDALLKLHEESLLQTEQLENEIRAFKDRGISKARILDIINRVYGSENSSERTVENT